MNARTVVCSVIAVCIGIAILTPPQASHADPILKPKKYEGPIPKHYFTFDIGVLGGANNADMWDFLDRQIEDPLKDQTNTEDFGASLALGLSYSAKLHPQFAVRTKLGLSILTSQSTGLDVPNVEPDTTGARPLIRFDRKFDVLLFALDATGMFFFQDASVKEFQSYIGAGFNLYAPYAKFTDDSVNEETGEPFASTETSDWSVQPGVHAVLGLLYHIQPTIAFTAEGRGQIGQSKFTLTEPTPEGPRSLNFDVDYTGFILTVGVAKFF